MIPPKEDPGEVSMKVHLYLGTAEKLVIYKNTLNYLFIDFEITLNATLEYVKSETSLTQVAQIAKIIKDIKLVVDQNWPLPLPTPKQEVCSF